MLPRTQATKAACLAVLFGYFLLPKNIQQKNFGTTLSFALTFTKRLTSFRQKANNIVENFCLQRGTH